MVEVDSGDGDERRGPHRTGGRGEHEAIAARAGVSVETVYAQGGKASLLLAALASHAGDRVDFVAYDRRLRRAFSIRIRRMASAAAAKKCPRLFQC